jgi:hypothetical protein
MRKVDKDRAEKAGDFLFRYMRARHRFRERTEPPLPFNELAMLISRGKEEFDEIYVEPETNPPIVLDGKADDFFTAIIKKNFNAMPDWEPELIGAWRNYVFSDGPIPQNPKLRRLLGSSTHPAFPA